jgi:3-methyladenine DNA glycosylase AlkD
VKRVVAKIERQLTRAGSAERKRVAEWYFPTRLAVSGVAVPDLRRIARSIEVAPSEVLPLARTLAKTGGFEARLVAYELLARFKTPLTTQSVEELGRGNDNWGVVDAFSVLVAGPAWRNGSVRDATVRRWARSRDRWWRRTALASTIALNAKSRGGTGDLKRTLAICRLLSGDDDDMVVKALSWALRELCKREPAAVRAFLQERPLHPRVVREVRCKLETGRKSR